MRKFFLLVQLCLNGLFATVFSIVSVDWILGGGCTRVLNRTYEPAFISQIWEVVSRIYTWAPEHTIFRFALFVIALAITIVLPVLLAVYFWKEFRKTLDKYRGL